MMTQPTPSLTAVVPVYNHEHAVANVVDGLLAAGLPCLLVDDGSGPECAASLDRLVTTHPGVTLIRRRINGGKGAAVADGLREDRCWLERTKIGPAPFARSLVVELTFHQFVSVG